MTTYFELHSHFNNSVILRIPSFQRVKVTFSINSTWTHTAGSNIIAPLGIKAVSLSGPGCPCTVRDHVGQSGAAGSMFSSPSPSSSIGGSSIES